MHGNNGGITKHLQEVLGRLENKDEIGPVLASGYLVRVVSNVYNYILLVAAASPAIFAQKNFLHLLFNTSQNPRKYKNTLQLWAQLWVGAPWRWVMIE